MKILQISSKNLRIPWVNIDRSKSSEIMEEKLAKEISQGRIAGPFHELPFVNMHISPIGVVP
jgi:hypothetical protein